VTNITLGWTNIFFIIVILLLSTSSVFNFIVYGQEDSASDVALVRIELIVNIVAGLAIAAGLVFAGYETMKSRHERIMTFRSWVGEAGAHLGIRRYFNSKKEITQYDDWQEMSVEQKKDFAPTALEWFIKLKNFGQLPAFIQGKSKLTIGKKPLRSEIKSLDYSPTFILMPQAEHDFLFDLNLEESASIQDDAVETFLIIDIIYRSANNLNKEREFGFIARVGQGSYNIEDSWIDS